MRPINLRNIKQTEPGTFKKLEPGVYPVIIQKVEDHPQAEYLTLVLDIVAGEYEGFFSTPFYEDKPYTHNITISYRDEPKVMENFAWTMARIGESNTGFDIDAAMEAGNFSLLENKVCGCVFACAEFFNKKTNEFEIGTNAQPKKIISTLQVQSGEYEKETDPIMLSRKGKLNKISYYLEKSETDAERWLNHYEAEREGGAKATPIQSTAPSVAQSGVYNGPIPFGM